MAAVGKIDPIALLPIIRKMVTDVLGTPALPEMALHQAANAAMAPADDTGPDPMAMQQQAHAQAMDRAQLGLQADQQRHAQAMDVAGHALAVSAANNKPTPGAPDAD